MKQVTFILVKDNLQTRTESILAVSQLQGYGWKVKHNKLSELI